MKIFSTLKYKLTELFILFVVMPVSFTVDFPFWIKFVLGLIGFAYVVFVILKIEKVSLNNSTKLTTKDFWIKTLLKFFLLVIITVIFVHYFSKNPLFSVLLNNPKRWLFFVFVYSIFSVFPQELVYRTFFFKRYSNLIERKSLFIFLNATVFALGHIFFRNTIVIIITFIGGILFAATYGNTKSTILVSVEHAIYGSWLYTIGMGGMLGFQE